MGPMRDYLQFTPPAGGVDDEDELGKLIAQMQAQQGPRVPMLPEVRRAAPPERQQASFWDLIPQLLAGAGDTVNAGAGMRSDSLGRVQGMQRGMRDQAYGDALNRQAVNYDNQRADRADELMRYQMQAQAQNQDFSRNQKLAELLMMHKALTDQAQKKSAMRAIFEQGLPMDLGEANSAQDLNKAAIKKLQETGGDPQMMEMVRAAQQRQIQTIAGRQAPGPVMRSVQGFTDQMNPWTLPWTTDFEVFKKAIRDRSNSPSLPGQESQWLLPKRQQPAEDNPWWNWAKGMGSYQP